MRVPDPTSTQTTQIKNSTSKSTGLPPCIGMLLPLLHGLVSVSVRKVSNKRYKVGLSPGHSHFTEKKHSMGGKLPKTGIGEETESEDGAQESN